MRDSVIIDDPYADDAPRLRVKTNFKRETAEFMRGLLDKAGIEYVEAPTVEMRLSSIVRRLDTLEAIVRNERMAFSKQDAAKMVGMSVRFVEKEIARGALPAKYAGTKPLIGRGALAEWFANLPDVVYGANREAQVLDQDTQKAREIAGVAADVVRGVPRKRGRKPKGEGAA